jgi:hypothetical protein
MPAPRGGDWSTVPFRKSSYSSTNGGQCVEVGTRPGVVAIRDSKSPGAGVVEIPAPTWGEFLSALQA